MSSLHTPHADIEDHSAPTTSATGGGRVRRQRRRQRRRRPSMAAGGSSETATDGSSFRFTESESEENPSWHSPAGSSSTACGDGGRSFDESTFQGVSGFSSGLKRPGSFDECAVQGTSGFSSGPRRPGRKGSWDAEEVDLESGELELMKVNVDGSREEERECRICHLSLTENDDGDNNGVNGVGIELGCDCKGDLGAAHKQCAETWFKTKGNTTCEICGAIAINIAGQQATDTSNTTGAASAAPAAPSVFSETRNFCHGRRIMNFLLACMVFAFIISWLFHFSILP